MIVTIIIFLFILSVIVFFHELGHFVVAKFYGVKVDEFGIGFPPKVYGVKKGETEYTINLIPLGGFVKIEGEDGENKDDPRSFASKSISKRFQIIAAGVLMNLFLAFIIFSAVFMIGSPQNITGDELLEMRNVRDIRNTRIQISSVVKNSPADKAGIRVGDAITKLNEKEVHSIEDVQNYTKENMDKNISLTLARGSEVFVKEITPRKQHPKGEGPIGVSLVKTAVISYYPIESIKRGYESVVYITMLVITAFASVVWNLFSTGKATAEVSGPVGIALMTQQAVSMGFVIVLNFTAMISINLAIINALPFPALDGGRLLFLVMEKIKGSPINREWETKANNTGFALLMLLMAVVTFRDLAKIDLWERIAGLFR